MGDDRRRDEVEAEEQTRSGARSAGFAESPVDLALHAGPQPEPAVALGEVHPRQAGVVLRASELECRHGLRVVRGEQLVDPGGHEREVGTHYTPARLRLAPRGALAGLGRSHRGGAYAFRNPVIRAGPHGEQMAMDLTMPTEWERSLRERLIAGDCRALEELYDQFGAFVYGLAARVIGDRTAAEDVTQEVFVTIWEKADQFDPERGRLRTYLGTLAHRRAVDWVRREEAKRRRAEREAGFASAVPDVDEMAMAIVAAERVRGAVDQLPPDRARRDQARVLRRTHVSASGPRAGDPRRNGEIATTAGATPHRRCIGSSRNRAVRMTGAMTPDEFDDIAAAYALDAVEPDDTARIEIYIAERPEAMVEVERLRAAAVWYGATDALTPPPRLARIGPRPRSGCSRIARRGVARGVGR